MGRWRRDAQEVVNDLVKQRSSSGEAAAVAGWGELTLSAEGRSLHANTSLLLAASPYLRRTLIKERSDSSGYCGCRPKFAIIVLVGVVFSALENLVKYLYGEEVVIEDDEEERKFMDAMKALEIEGPSMRNVNSNEVDKNENETVLVDEATSHLSVAENSKISSTSTSPSILEDKTLRIKTPLPLEAEKLEEMVQEKQTPEETESTIRVSEQRLSVKHTSSVTAEKKWIRPVTPPRKSNLLGAGIKKYSRQMTLPSMAKRRAVKEEKVVDLTNSEVFNGGVRKIKNSSGSSGNQMPPPNPPSAKRKSDELERNNKSEKVSKKSNTSSTSNTSGDDDFINSSSLSEDLFDADVTMFTSPIQSPQINPGVSKRNKREDIKPLIEDEDSRGENSDVLNDLSENLSPVIVRRKPLSPLNKTNDEIRNSRSSINVKKQLFGGDKLGNTSATQQLVRDFNKIPERVKEDRGEKSRPTKEEKAQMDGWSCEECANWYKGLESQMHPREVERLRQTCSKHRKEKDYQPPPSTPPDFWNTSMPSTAEAYRTGLLQVLSESYEDSFFLKD